MGDGFYMMAEMTFADKESLKAAMKSPEMAAAGENLNGFAAGLVTFDGEGNYVSATNTEVGIDRRNSPREAPNGTGGGGLFSRVHSHQQ